MKKLRTRMAIFTAIALLIPMLLLPEIASAKPSGALNWGGDDRTGNGGVGWANKDANYGRKGYYRRDLIEKEEAEAKAALEAAEAEKAAEAAEEENIEEVGEETAAQAPEAVLQKDSKVIAFEKLIKKYNIWNYVLNGFAGGEPMDTVFAEEPEEIEETEETVQNEEK